MLSWLGQEFPTHDVEVGRLDKADIRKDKQTSHKLQF